MLMTCAEYAEHVRTAPSNVRKWCREGTIESMRLPNGEYRIDPEAADSSLRKEEKDDDGKK